MRGIILLKIAIFSCLIGITGCQSLPKSVQTDVSGQTARADGTVIDWMLTRAQKDSPKPVLIIAQGSGCSVARTNSNVALLANKLSEFALLTVEKYGVAPEDTPDDPMNSCSNAFFDHHTVSQRVRDVKNVLHDLRSRALWDGRLILFGGSEGGAVVSILSSELREADAVVVFSTGTGLTMSEFIPMVVPPPVAAQMITVFEQVRANPDPQGIVGGNSYKWWSDILDRRLSDDLLKANIPVLIVHGQNDQSAPVEAARAARDAFTDAGEIDRLTYWEFPHRDHQMIDEQGDSHLAEVLSDIASWIREQECEKFLN